MLSILPFVNLSNLILVCGLSKPPPYPPPKWPRKSYSDLTSQPGLIFRPSIRRSTQSALNFNFGRLGVKQRLGNHSDISPPPLTSVTLLPDGKDDFNSVQMMAVIEEDKAAAEIKVSRRCRWGNAFNQQK